MTSAPTSARVQKAEMGNGRQVAWRQEVAGLLLNLQQPDGSSINTKPRWREDDKHLVTSCVLLSLEMLQSALPRP
jgi:hypothetical protein